MKMKKFAGVVSLVLLFAILFSACSTTQVGGADGLLDLDYIGTGNVAVDKDKADEPWYAWIKRAFSFGSTDTETDKNEKPDSVADFYNKGNEQLNQSGNTSTDDDNNEEDSGGNKNPTTNNQKPSNKKDDTVSNDNNKQDNKTDGQNKPQQGDQQEETKPKGNTVTLTIRCDTAVKNGMHLESKWAGIVPASGCILDVTEFEIEEGDTVFDVLCQARNKYKLHMEYEGVASSIYVQGINNLYEFDGGRWSGWMYCVNDWYPNYGCGVYYLQPGDVIEWNYTCDLGCDLENGDPYGYGKDWKDNHD